MSQMNENPYHAPQQQLTTSELPGPAPSQRPFAIGRLVFWGCASMLILFTLLMLLAPAMRRGGPPSRHDKELRNIGSAFHSYQEQE